MKQDNKTFETVDESLKLNLVDLHHNKEYLEKTISYNLDRKIRLESLILRKHVSEKRKIKLQKRINVSSKSLEQCKYLLDEINIALEKEQKSVR